jgi:uncharacterized DUF497 family protein
MKIVWDEIKRQKNIQNHGHDFAGLTEDFFLDAMIVPAKRDRLMAIGVLGDGVIAVVFVRLGREGLSLISMRPASRKERKSYEQWVEDNPSDP